MKGCGEAGTVGSLASLANAVHDAMGPRASTPRDMPFTPPGSGTGCRRLPLRLLDRLERWLRRPPVALRTPMPARSRKRAAGGGRSTMW